MRSYRPVSFTRTQLSGVPTYEGQWLHHKIRKMLDQEESIDEISARIYTEKKDGVLPDYDIRTDKWEHASQAMDVVHKNEIAKGMPSAPEDKEGADIKPSKRNPLSDGNASDDGSVG